MDTIKFFYFTNTKNIYEYIQKYFDTMSDQTLASGHSGMRLTVCIPWLWLWYAPLVSPPAPSDTKYQQLSKISCKEQVQIRCQLFHLPDEIVGHS